LSNPPVLSHLDLTFIGRGSAEHEQAKNHRHTVEARSPIPELARKAFALESQLSQISGITGITSVGDQFPP
jgi:hypothetical protein